MSLTAKGRPFRLSFDWLKPPESSPDGSMTLFEHLAELRYRLVIAAIALLVGTVVAWFFRERLIEVLLYPYTQAMADLKASNPGQTIEIINNGLSSPLTLALKVSALAGAIATAPVWLYQVWAFIVPGLLAKEKKWALIFIGSATPLFLSGVAVGYLVMPKGISVLLGFTQEGITNLQDVNAFLSFLMRIMLVFGVAFLIPLVVLLLNIIGVLPAKYLSKYRTLVIFFCFVFGAVATPSTDPFSMLALALPMSLLFLIAEVLAHVFDRRKRRRLAAGGGDLEVAASVENDRALRELGDGPETSDPAR